MKSIPYKRRRQDKLGPTLDVLVQIYQVSVENLLCTLCDLVQNAIQCSRQILNGNQ